MADSFEQRKERVTLNLQNKKADKVPYIMWRADFVVNYFDTPMSQIDSYDKMFEIFKKANDEFNTDVFDIAAPLLLFNEPRFEIFGGGTCILMPDKNFIQINQGNLQIMEPVDYDDLIKIFLVHVLISFFQKGLGF